MNKYNKLLRRFEDIKNKVKALIDRYPPEKREQILFDEWSLKDVVAHLNHWMIHDIDCLEHLLVNKEPFWEPDVEEFNRKGVQMRKGKSGDELYLEFTSLMEQLIALYTDLPEKLQNKRIWKNKKETATTFLKEDIKHWEGEHIPSLESNLE